MPQMAPLMWTSLFVTFLMLLLLVYTKILFLYAPILSETSHNKTEDVCVKKFSWKW